MLVSRLCGAVLCVGTLLATDVGAGQDAGQSQVNQDLKLMRCVYSIADIVRAKSDKFDKPGQSAAEVLINRITQTVAPESWAEVGGNASIQYYPLGLAVIVEQTQPNQEKIIDVLTAIRRDLPVEVKVETRIFSLPQTMAEGFIAAAGFPQVSGDPQASASFAFLTAKQVEGWMSIFQGQRECNVMQAPKITGYSGQQIELKVGQEMVLPLE